MNLKNGQKVRVKTIEELTPLSTGISSKGILSLPHPGFNSDMQKLCGKVCHILHPKSQLTTGLASYYLVEDDRGWTWVEWMFVVDCNDLVFDKLKGEI